MNVYFLKETPHQHFLIGELPSFRHPVQVRSKAVGVSACEMPQGFYLKRSVFTQQTVYHVAVVLYGGKLPVFEFEHRIFADTNGQREVVRQPKSIDEMLCHDITKEKVTEIFCIIDEFDKNLDVEMRKNLVAA